MVLVRFIACTCFLGCCLTNVHGTSWVIHHGGPCVSHHGSHCVSHHSSIGHHGSISHHGRISWVSLYSIVSWLSLDYSISEVNLCDKISLTHRSCWACCLWAIFDDIKRVHVHVIIPCCGFVTFRLQWCLKSHVFVLNILTRAKNCQVLVLRIYCAFPCRGFVFLFAVTTVARITCPITIY